MNRIKESIENQCFYENQIDMYRSQLQQLLVDTNYNSFGKWFSSNLTPLLAIALSLKRNDELLAEAMPCNFGYLKSFSNSNYSLLPYTETLRFSRLRNQSRKKKIFDMIIDRCIDIPFNQYIFNNLAELFGFSFCLSTNELMVSQLGRNPVPIISYGNFYTHTKNIKVNYLSHEHNILKSKLLAHVESFFAANSLDYPRIPITSLINYMVKKIAYDTKVIESKLFRYTNNIHTSSGGLYESMLLSHIKTKKKFKVLRYEHGGERIFFSDHVFWDYELFGCDYYYTYSSKSAELLREYSNNINIIATRSKYYSRTPSFSNFTTKNPSLLLMGVSYVGEAIQLAHQKSLDINQYLLESTIMKIISKITSKSAYKSHPKGFGQNFVAKQFSNVINTPLHMVYEEYTHFIFTYIGTAAIESLLAGKSIMYVDTGIRHTSKLFSHLQEIIYYYPMYSSGTSDLELESAIHDFCNWNVDPHKIAKFQDIFYKQQ